MSRITIHVDVPSTGKTTSTVEVIGNPIEVFGLLGEATTNALSQNIQQLMALPQYADANPSGLIDVFCKCLKRTTLKRLTNDDPAEKTAKQATPKPTKEDLAALIVDGILSGLGIG